MEQATSESDWVYVKKEAEKVRTREANDSYWGYAIEIIWHCGSWALVNKNPPSCQMGQLFVLDFITYIGCEAWWSIMSTSVFPWDHSSESFWQWHWVPHPLISICLKRRFFLVVAMNLIYLNSCIFYQSSKTNWFFISREPLSAA